MSLLSNGMIIKTTGICSHESMSHVECMTHTRTLRTHRTHTQAHTQAGSETHSQTAKDTQAQSQKDKHRQIERETHTHTHQHSHRHPHRRNTFQRRVDNIRHGGGHVVEGMSGS